MASRTSARRRVGGRAVAVQQHRMGVAVKMGKGAGVLEGGGDGGVVGLAAARRSQVVTRATQESTDEEEAEEEEQRLAESELARLRQLPLSDSINGEGGENVVGAEGVPKAIIEAERKSKPLRRWRLVIYALASSAAAAQVRNTTPLRPLHSKTNHRHHHTERRDPPKTQSATFFLVG